MIGSSLAIVLVGAVVALLPGLPLFSPRKSPVKF